VLQGRKQTIFGQPTRTSGEEGDMSHHGHWTAGFSGTNSFVTDFRYQG
jgi:hypothetical protein